MTDKPPQRARALNQSNFTVPFPYFRPSGRPFELLSSPPQLLPYNPRSPPYVAPSQPLIDRLS